MTTITIPTIDGRRSEAEVIDTFVADIHGHLFTFAVHRAHRDMGGLRVSEWTTGRCLAELPYYSPRRYQRADALARIEYKKQEYGEDRLFVKINEQLAIQPRLNILPEHASMNIKEATSIPLTAADRPGEVGQGCDA